MNRFLKLLVLVIPFSFLMGTWWGLRSIEKRMFSRNRSGVQLKLLYRRGYLPPQILNDFEEKTGLHIEGFPVESDQALWEEVSERPANYDLIQLFSYMAKDPVGSHIFAELNPLWAPRLDKVSVDFNHLPFDPKGQFLLPLNWGLNGFLWNQKNGKPPQRLKQLLDDKRLKGKIYLLPNQVEIFSYMQKTGGLLPEWLDQEKWDQLSEATKKLLEDVNIEGTLPQDIWKKGQAEVVQIANGPAAALLQQPAEERPQFWLPEDKTNLWISLMGISKSTSHLEEAHEFISFLLEDSSIQLLVKFNKHATSLQPDKATAMKAMQLPGYLRQIALDKIHLQTETASLTPIWFRTLSKTLPLVFPDPRQAPAPLPPEAPTNGEADKTPSLTKTPPPEKPVKTANKQAPPVKPKPVAIPKPVVKTKTKPVAEAKPKPAAKPQPTATTKPKPKPQAVAKPPAPKKTDPTPKTTPSPQPVVKPKPVAKTKPVVAKKATPVKPKAKKKKGVFPRPVSKENSVFGNDDNTQDAPTEPSAEKLATPQPSSETAKKEEPKTAPPAKKDEKSEAESDSPFDEVPEKKTPPADAADQDSETESD